MKSQECHQLYGHTAPLPQGNTLLVRTPDPQAISVGSSLQGSFHLASMRSVYSLPPNVTEALQGPAPGGKQTASQRALVFPATHRDAPARPPPRPVLGLLG